MAMAVFPGAKGWRRPALRRRSAPRSPEELSGRAGGAIRDGFVHADSWLQDNARLPLLPDDRSRPRRQGWLFRRGGRVVPGGKSGWLAQLSCCFRTGSLDVCLIAMKRRQLPVVTDEDFCPIRSAMAHYDGRRLEYARRLPAGSQPRNVLDPTESRVTS